jgi:hypothetical protein
MLPSWRGLFATSTTGFWYRILPIEDHDDNISVALSIEWRYLLPLLAKGGLVYEGRE